MENNESEKYKIEKAITMYEEKKVNLNTAACFAGLSVRDFMNEMENRGMTLNLTPEMVNYSLNALAEIFGNKKLKKALMAE